MTDFNKLLPQYAMSHSDDELVMPADLKSIVDLHKRHYLALKTKITAANLNNPMNQASNNLQAAMSYIDGNFKNDDYFIDSSRYSMLIIALWYAVDEMSNMKPEEASGLIALFKKKVAEVSAINGVYKKYSPSMLVTFHPCTRLKNAR